MVKAKFTKKENVKLTLDAETAEILMALLGGICGGEDTTEPIYDAIADALGYDFLSTDYPEFEEHFKIKRKVIHAR